MTEPPTADASDAHIWKRAIAFDDFARVCCGRVHMRLLDDHDSFSMSHLVGVTAVVLPPRGVVYGVASRRVFDVVRGVVPVVEHLSFDEAFGSPRNWPGRRRRTSRRSARACDDGCVTRPG